MYRLNGAFLSHDRKQKQAEIVVNVQALVALTHHFGEAMAARDLHKAKQATSKVSHAAEETGASLELISLKSVHAAADKLVADT